MKFEWDTEKARLNAEKHGVDFRSVSGFDFETAVVVVDDRFAYRETRFVALGLIGPRVHQLAFTMRGNSIRVISLRKANRREIRTYVDTV